MTSLASVLLGLVGLGCGYEYFTSPDDQRVVWLWALILINLYFVPFYIARHRKVETAGLLFLINAVFGWTLVGWFACLLWAALGQTEAQAAFYANAAKGQP